MNAHLFKHEFDKIVLSHILEQEFQEKCRYDMKTRTGCCNTIIHLSLHHGKNINQDLYISCHLEVSFPLCIMVVEFSLSKTIKEA